jgi:hypothetical protein
MGDLLRQLGIGNEQAVPGGSGGLQLPGLPQAPDDIVVTGDGWKPHKPTTLGRIADVLMNEPYWANKSRETNMKGAMETILSDPEKMRSEYVDDQRQQTATQIQNERLTELRRDRIAQMMGALTPENSSKLLPAIKGLASKYGIEDLPDQYDPDTVSLWRYGGMKVDQQVDNDRDAEYKGTRLKQYDRSIQSMDEHRDAQIGISQQRLGETRRHNETMEGVAAKREERQGAKTPGLGKVLRDKNTGAVIGNIAPSGKHAFVQRGGRTLVFDVLPGGGVKFNPKKTKMAEEAE